MLWYLCGLWIIGLVDLTWLTGYLRYKRVKELLALPREAIPEHFGRFRMKYQALGLGVGLVAILVLYVPTGIREIRGGWSGDDD